MYVKVKAFVNYDGEEMFEDCRKDDGTYDYDEIFSTISEYSNEAFELSDFDEYLDDESGSLEIDGDWYYASRILYELEQDRYYDLFYQYCDNQVQDFIYDLKSLDIGDEFVLGNGCTRFNGIVKEIEVELDLDNLSENTIYTDNTPKFTDNTFNELL